MDSAKYEVFKNLNGKFVICRDQKWWLKDYINLDSMAPGDAKQFSEMSEVDEHIRRSASYHGLALILVATTTYEKTSA